MKYLLIPFLALGLDGCIKEHKWVMVNEGSCPEHIREYICSVHGETKVTRGVDAKVNNEP